MAVDKNNHHLMGILYAIMAYVAWGILPLYWKLIKIVPALEILAYRITWSFIFVITLLFFYNGWKRVKMVLVQKKNLFYITLASLLIGLNWFTYIYGVNSGHVVEASLGYYINPLITVVLGVLVLNEGLTKAKGAALVLATIGVIVITLQYGQIPWISLTLALSFSFYGLLKKLAKVDSIVGLAIETAILMPLAVGYILYRQILGIGALGQISIITTIILFGSGIATATPLLWFAKSTERIELSTIGFIQYISPTISLLLGIIVFKESFTVFHLIGFGLIWAGLIIYSVSKTTFFKSKEALLIKRREMKEQLR